MEFKPLIDYAKVPERRRSIEPEAGSFFKAVIAWVGMFGYMLAILLLIGNAGYFN